MKKRINNIEFRWSDWNTSYELVKWFNIDKDVPYCIVIALFRKHNEGYDLKTVGRRYLDALIEHREETILLTEYAFNFLMAEFNLYQTALENNITVTSE